MIKNSIYFSSFVPVFSALGKILLENAQVYSNLHIKLYVTSDQPYIIL